VIRERREGYKTSHHSEGNSKPREYMFTVSEWQ